MEIALGANLEVLVKVLIIEKFGALLAFGPEAVRDILLFDPDNGIFWFSE